MKKKIDFLLIALIAVFLISIVFSIFKFFVFHNYQILAETSCDPELEACFVYECDPETEECTGDPEEDTWYYKLIQKNGANIEVCNPAEEECAELSCGVAESDCEEILCDEETLSDAGEGVYCSNPADFAESEDSEEGALEDEEGSLEESEEGEEVIDEDSETSEEEVVSEDGEIPEDAALMGAPQESQNASNTP